MKDILKLSLPEQIYIDDTLLEIMVRWGYENYSLPEEVLSHFCLTSRYWKYWIVLAKTGDERSQRIVDEFDGMVNRWINKTRTRVLDSRDIKSVSNTLMYYQDRKDRLDDNGLDSPVQDNWLD